MERPMPQNNLSPTHLFPLPSVFFSSSRRSRPSLSCCRWFFLNRPIANFLFIQSPSPLSRPSPSSSFSDHHHHRHHRPSPPSSASPSFADTFISDHHTQKKKK
ncbi:hypothetical protein SLEP1_g47540 [Rubroshorea leprosula]|uniref:Uncharacterized protein n=1 Tax=Rubroshorea leprosula TaxID=152421 RepID=A0AAV5LRR5_9ROSI|nr:hypothetical protein SLEP1_g47540 [Rubroshorea leprosula]